MCEVRWDEVKGGEDTKKKTLMCRPHARINTGPSSLPPPRHTPVNVLSLRVPLDRIRAETKQRHHTSPLVLSKSNA